LAIIKSKNIDRLFIVASHSVSQFLPSASNLITSAIVIRLLVPEWWGQITVLQLYMYLATQFCAWGNKDYLMKRFSEDPSSVPSLWMESISSRFFLLILAIAGAFFVTHDQTSFYYLSIWLIFRFFNQAFEAPVLFSRKFAVMIISEIIGIFFTATGLLLFRSQASIADVLLIITIGYASKTIFQIIYFRSYFNLSFSFLPNIKKLKLLLPFMMLGFAGVMQQKSDMICVVWFCNKLEVAQYQVFSSFLIFIQTIPGLIAGPYIKNLYRISPSSYPKIQFQFSVIGVMISIVLSTITFFAITMVYHFELPISMYFCGFLYGLFTYFYMLQIYLLFKDQKQNQVMWISICSIIFNFILCFIFIPIWGIQGAVVANVLSQLVLFVGYKYYWKYTQSIK